MERTKFFGAVFLCLLIDGLFLIAWLAVHWALSKGETWFGPVGVERGAVSLLRVILEVPTLIVIAIFIVADIKRIYLRIFQGAAKELTAQESQQNAIGTIDLDGNNSAGPVAQRVSSEETR